MKKIIVVLVALSFLATTQASEITCSSQAFASCKTEESCFDFFEGPGVDLDMLEGMCGQMNGEFFESACDRTGVIYSCLNATNFIMPMTHFFAPMEREDAEDMCLAMGGKSC